MGEGTEGDGTRMQTKGKRREEEGNGKEGQASSVDTGNREDVKRIKREKEGERE